jgi:hypothetical protein
LVAWTNIIATDTNQYLPKKRENIHICRNNYLLQTDRKMTNSEEKLKGGGGSQASPAALENHARQGTLRKIFSPRLHLSLCARVHGWTQEEQQGRHIQTVNLNVLSTDPAKLVSVSEGELASLIAPLWYLKRPLQLLRQSKTLKLFRKVSTFFLACQPLPGRPWRSHDSRPLGKAGTTIYTLNAAPEGKANPSATSRQVSQALRSKAR